MGRLDTAKSILDVISTATNVATSIAQARRDAQEAKRKAEDDEKDRRIKELEAQLAEARRRP